MAVELAQVHDDADQSRGRPLLGAFLVRRGLLTVERLEQGLAEQERSGLPLGQVLVGLGLITSRDLAEALAEQHGLEFLDLSAASPEEEAVKRLPESDARRYQALPVRVEDGTLVVAVADPTNVIAHDDLRLALGTHTRIVVADSDQLAETISRAYNARVGAIETFSSDAWRANEESDEQLDLDDSAPAIRFVNDVIAKALTHRASDIHFEPRADRLVVRIRVDGVTSQLTEINNSTQAAVLARLKVMGGLDIASAACRRTVASAIRVGGRPMDLRIAVLPTTFGEQAVLRILQGGGTKARSDLSELGMDSATEAILRRAIERPYGAIITVGPTGSGKTTTLYAALGVLDDPGACDRHDRGSGRVPDARRGADGDRPTGRLHLRPRPAHDPPQRPGRDPGRRDPRRGDGADRHAGGDDRTSCPQHPPRAERVELDRPPQGHGRRARLLAPSLNCIVAQRLVRRLCLTMPGGVRADRRGARELRARALRGRDLPVPGPGLRAVPPDWLRGARRPLRGDVG